MGLVLYLVLSQVTYQPGEPVRLDLPPIPFERVTVTKNYILLVDEGERVIQVFGKDGRHRGSLGKREQIFQLPTRASWLDDQKAIMVYDAAGRFFSLWNEQGRMMGKKETDFDLFFTVGRLQFLNGGYIAPVSLTHKKYLMARFDTDFRITDYAFEVIDDRLIDMSPVVRKAFAGTIKYDGKPAVVAGQSLSTDVQIYGPRLQPLKVMGIDDDRWQKVNYRRLERVSKNPVELDALKTSFSEVIGIEGISGGVFLVAYRNLEGAPFTYQCFEANSENPVGRPYDSPLVLAGSHGGTIYLRDPNAAAMTLVPCRIQR